MKDTLKAFFKGIFKFFASPAKLCFLMIVLLSYFALTEYHNLGLARRTFVFYTVSDGTVVVEDRMLKHSDSHEDDILRYVEETILGPVSPDLRPLVSGGARLLSFLYRDGVVYINLSEDAALPPIEGGDTAENFLTFYAGILRNFSYVEDVRFYIEGNSIFNDENLMFFR